MTEDTSSIRNLVDELNNQFALHDGDGESMRPFQFITDGDQQTITFFDYPLWNSEEDERDGEEMEGFAPLCKLVVREANRLMLKFGKITLQ